MLNQLQDLPSYSEDIWDYLTDMRYMPSRQDRDNLIKQSNDDNSQQKRIRLWDYFFRIRPNDVGLPLQGEIRKLQKSMSDSQKERTRLFKEIEKLKLEFESKKSGAEHQVMQQLLNSSTRKRTNGIIFGILASPFIFYPIVILFLGLIGSLGQPINSYNVSGWVSNFFCCYPMGLVFAGIAGWQLLNSKKPTEDKIQIETAKFLNEEQKKLSSKIQELSLNSQNDESLYPEYEQRIKFLEKQLDSLNSQIPMPPSDEQVDKWLQEDIQELTQVAIADSGLHGRLISLLKANNPFCTYSPAEIQDEKSIRDVFLTQSHWEKNSDKFKHFHAKYFTTMPDGSFVDFHGIYSVRFLMFAENEWSSYETVFDFIRGKSTGKKTSRYDYINVVAIKTLKSVRTIQSNDGEDIDIENIPSLSVSLTNQEQVNISFPDEGYFRQFENGNSFNEAKWRYNPQLAAENAVKNFKEKVNEAQRNRDNRQMS